MTRIAVRIARVAATTVTFPIRGSAAAAGAAAGILIREQLLFARSPLSPEARRMRRQHRELASAADRAAAEQAVTHIFARRGANGQTRRARPARARQPATSGHSS